MSNDLAIPLHQGERPFVPQQDITDARAQIRYGQRAQRTSIYSGFGKRLFDLSFLLLALPILLPMIGLLACIARLDGGAAFFSHKRIGKNGQLFSCLKIRTMVPDAEARLQEYLAENPDQMSLWQQNFKLENDPRITRIGTFLRSTSLDELPQFLNVLKGDLSVVGPRPVTPEELAKYGDAAAEVFAQRPGITGLWQVCGRNDLSYDDRVDLDLSYVRTVNFWTDLRLVVLTVGTVLKRTGL
nr:sugar transferase [uncultured Celeribacter sp.]